jgi:hypothetical protein
MIDVTKLTLYAGKMCPVPPDVKVVYRTISHSGHISHIHMGIRAGEINWGIHGKIYDYGIVKQ